MHNAELQVPYISTPGEICTVELARAVKPGYGPMQLKRCTARRRPQPLLIYGSAVPHQLESHDARMHREQRLYIVSRDRPVSHNATLVVASTVGSSHEIVASWMDLLFANCCVHEVRSAM